MRGKAQRLARPARLQNSGATGPKFASFYQTYRGVIGGVKACIIVALWNASAHNEGGVRRSSPIPTKISYHSNLV